MPILRFETNIAQALHMIRLEGKVVDSKFGGSQMMFTAEEGAFYVSETVGGVLAEQFRTLGIKPGELIEITRSEVGRGPERRTRWIVSTTDPAFDATLAVPKLPPVAQAVAPDPARAATELEQALAASIRMVEQRKQAASATAAAPAWATYLVEQSNALIDAYAQVLKHSARHEGLVKGDDVRSLFLSAFINVTKGGNRNAA